MKVQDIVELAIIKFDYFGNGVAKKDGYTIFVDDALPDDICKCELYQVKKGYARAKIIKIIKSSSSRIIPSCPHYDVCGGCDMMHTKDELAYKKQKVEELLNHPVREVLSGDDFYRNKAIFHVKNNSIGFYQEKTNQVIEINECQILEPLILETYHFIKENVSLKKVDKVLVRTCNNEVMIVYYGDKVDTNIKYPPFIHSVYHNEKCIYGNSYLYEELNGLKFRVSPKSFFQVNTKMAEVLYNQVCVMCERMNNPVILDLYSGTGTVGLSLADKARKVIGIEIVKEAVLDAKENAKLNNIHNSEFIVGKVEDKIAEIGNVDLVILDPPRKGSDEKTLQAVEKLYPQQIIYISCNPITLKRDLNHLPSYKVEDIVVVNMFLHTKHVECICILKKM